MAMDPLAASRAGAAAHDGIGARLKEAADSGDQAALEHAAQQFEAYFVQEMLGSMRSTTEVVGSDLFDSSATDTWNERLDMEVARSVAKGPGLGLARMVMQSLQARSDVPRPAAISGLDRAGWSWPLSEPGRISSDFGARRHPISGSHRHHAGLDIAAPEGTPVLAASPGRVTHAGPAGGYGLLVEIDHGDGIVTRYAHQAELAVEVGQDVDAGAVLGAVGSTGASTGPHLHLEVRRDGEAVDPLSFLRGGND